MVTEATPQNGILESNEQGLITWAVTDPNSIASKSLTIDGVADNAVGGPFGSDYYGLIIPLTAGDHSFAITMTDNLSQTTTYTGTFYVAPGPGPQISGVVVAEATPQNGILESNEQGVVTWAVTDSNSITSTSLTIDGVADNDVGGPFGSNYYGIFGPVAAGTHSYIISVTDSINVTTNYLGTFSVVAPLAVSAAAAPQGVAAALSVEPGPHTLAANGSPAADRGDLLTTVMHEMGHGLGYSDDAGDLMNGTLPPGVRRTSLVDEAFATL